MRILLSIIALCFCVCLSYEAEADVSYHYTNLVNNIKPNLIVRSKPTSQFIKLASVQFLTDGNALDFKKVELDVKTQCQVSGYVLPVSSCDKLGKNSGILCPLNDDNAKYTDKCCDKSYDKKSEEECNNNAVLSSDFCMRGASDAVEKYYKCECPESAYPYVQENDCPAGYRLDHNPAKVCEANGEKRYSTCIPKSYVDCSKEGSVNGVNGLLGNYATGHGFLQDGTEVFAECRCPSDYTNYGCSTFLLTTDVCKKDDRTYYKDGDCYSGCTDSSLFDADYYYKQSALRCLFDYNTEETTYENIITINNSDKNKALCTRVVNGEEQVSRQTCSEMGYVYNEDECPNKEFLMLRCPSDKTKVWCMNANGCVNYPVSGNACSEGAKVSYCGSDKTRCVYTEVTCNKNWNEGTLNGVASGSTELCCKDGWDYINGICVPHDCGDIEYLYPYGDRYPLPEVAEGGDKGISRCKSGNNIYYGYRQCKGCAYGDTYTSNSCSDLWQPAADNPNKCVCKTEGLPYDQRTLYTSGGSGKLGSMKTCVDPEATYYGYAYCSRFYKMEYSGDVATGACGSTDAEVGTFPYEASTIKTATVTQIAGACSEVDEQRCAGANAELCRNCTDKLSEYVIIHNYGNAAAATKSQFYGYQKCPPERPYKANTYVCYGKCAFGSADCKRGDAVYYPDVASGKFIGAAYLVKNGVVYIMGPKHGSYTWEEAIVAGSNYAPAGYENDVNIGRGKWHLFSDSDGSYRDIGWYFGQTYVDMFTAEGAPWNWNFWTTRDRGDDYAYYMYDWGYNPLLKSTKYNIVPVITYNKT